MKPYQSYKMVILVQQDKNKSSQVVGKYSISYEDVRLGGYLFI